MSKSPSETSKENTNSLSNDSRLDKKHRHSLQPKSTSTEIPAGALRLTQSHRYDSRKKKRPASTPQISSIMEAENSEEEVEKGVELKTEKGKAFSVVYENETKSSKKSKSKKTENNSKATFVFDNAAFDGNMNTKRNSSATIRTNSSRAPSIQSLEVVREQYCCCAKRTKCERTLIIVVTVLSIIIIVLVIVIAVIANHDELDAIGHRYLGV